jgi:16S rRNA (cytidine1402-2'-O)-methyltransferase
LKSSDIIVCEDTRHSLRLLNRFEIRKQLLSCHGYNEERTAERVVSELDAGKTLAYISDAGTPGISDPGAVLVRRVRLAGHTAIPVPGPSALTALMSVGGMSGKGVLFEGFLSPKAGRRRTRLAELLDMNLAFVLYESPFRIVKLLEELASQAPERRVLVGREMTKIHEEYLEDTAAAVSAAFSSRAQQRGEFAILVAGG